MSKDNFAIPFQADGVIEGADHPISQYCAPQTSLLILYDVSLITWLLM
jgi:hypothetical protein